MPTTLQHVFSRLTATPPDPRTDAALIAAFLHSADEAAFTELVRRHGPAVLGVCRRFLGPTPDAEDAFQATFLVLVRRARRADWRESLGPWLYGVALKVARKARTARARRAATERQATAMTDPTTPPAEPDDAAVVIDEELAGLPRTVRLPLILCELQGLSRRDAARELGIAEGTLSSRLARGRKRLRAALARRGVVPAAGGLAVAVPAGLSSATVRSAIGLLTCAAGAVPVGVLNLTEGVVKTMIVKWKLAAVLVAACVGVSGFGAWRGSSGPASVATAADPPARPAAKAEAPAAQPKAPEPVATIFGDVAITREQFADHLIRRYGKKELEGFVNKQIIAREFAKKGFVIKPADVEATLDETCAALNMTRERFEKEVLPRYNKTLEEWTEDTIVPQVMLSKLCKAKMPPATEAELRQAFDRKYGEKLDCRIILWPKADADEAHKAYEKIRTNEKEFGELARRRANPSMMPDGRIPPIPRAKPFEEHKPEQTAHVAVVNLKAGEVSELVAVEMEGGEALIVFRCDRVIPADKSKSFETEKAALLTDVMTARLNNEIPKLFKELKREAAPKYHLTFPDPAPKK